MLGTDDPETTVKPGVDASVGDDDDDGDGGDAGSEQRDAGPCSGDLSSNADHCGRCDHSCFGGECKDSVCRPVVLAADRRTPSDLLRVGAYLYVTEMGTSDQHYADGRITRIRIDGCQPKSPSCITSFADDVEGPVALAANSETMYVAQWQGGVGGGSILAFPFPDGTPRTIFAPNQSRPMAVVVDQTTAPLGGTAAAYWVNTGSTATNGAIRREWLEDGTPGGSSIVANLASPYALVVNGNDIFFTESGGVSTDDGTVHRAEIDGANDGTLATGQAQPKGLAYDGTYVYWANRRDGTVRRVLADGTGKDEPIITGCRQPVGVAVDASHIYVVENGNEPDRLDGRVRAADLKGNNVVELASGLAYARGLRIDDDSVYFVETGTIDKVYGDGTVNRIAKP